MMENDKALSELERRKYIEYLKSSGLTGAQIRNAGFDSRPNSSMFKPVYEELQKVPVADQADFLNETIDVNKAEDAAGKTKPLSDESKKNYKLLEIYLNELHGNNQDLT
jgi:hypothetical protein